MGALIIILAIIIGISYIVTREARHGSDTRAAGFAIFIAATGCFVISSIVYLVFQ